MNSRRWKLPSESVWMAKIFWTNKSSATISFRICKYNDISEKPNSLTSFQLVIQVISKLADKQSHFLKLHVIISGQYFSHEEFAEIFVTQGRSRSVMKSIHQSSKNHSALGNYPSCHLKKSFVTYFIWFSLLNSEFHSIIQCVFT